MKDRRYDSNGEVIEEWERVPTIPDDFIYDQETDSYYPPGEPCMWDAEESMRELEQIIAERDPTLPLLITAEELRAAGAFDYPPEWRKSLGPAKAKPSRQRSLFSDETDDESSEDV